MTRSNDAEHDAVIELLPWYVNGTLDSAEQARVARHLPSCPECQQELLQYRQFDNVRSASSNAQTWQPTPAQFAHILQGIDALESESTIGTTASPVKMPGRLAKLSAWLKATPSPVFWFMTLETVALTALVLLVVTQPPQSPGEQLFQTLSNERPPVSSTLPRLSIVFVEDITEREIRALLQTQQGQLVQGPSMLGVYTVQLASGGEHGLQQAIINLRTHPKVKLVEAIRE